VVPIRITCPAGSHLLDGLLDSAADDTIFPLFVSALIGLDLSAAPEHPVTLAGRAQPIAVRYQAVTLRITDGVQETYEWTAVVGFAAVPLRRALLGQAGFLEFCNADFRGADHEVFLATNLTFPGRRI
jgi:hypothetical protein